MISVVNDGLWWLEEASKVVRAYVAATATMVVALPESMRRFTVVIWVMLGS